MASKALIATALLSCALVLSGCSGDPQPKEPPRSSTSSPVATAPAMPSEASEASEEGAVAFVKHYIELLNYAANTGDVKPLKQASDPKCEGCNSYIDEFKSTYDRGGDIQDFEWSTERARFTSSRTLEAQIMSGEYKFRQSNNASWSTVKAAEYAVSFQLKFGDGRWLARELLRPNGNGQ